MSHLLMAYDFPPLGGGIARMMGEVAKRYPPGSLVISTGSTPGSAGIDAKFSHPVDRIPVPAGRLRTIQGVVRWSMRGVALARSLGPDFTWCGNFKPAAYPARWVKKRVGTPYGIMLYGTELLLLRSRIGTSFLKRRAAQSLFGQAAVLLTISRYTQDLCRETLGELNLGDAIDVPVVPLGTDPRHFRPGLDTGGVRARYGLGSGRWLITVARLAAHKGIDTVLRVLAALGPAYPDLKYVVVGSGVRERELQQLAESLGVSHRVRFLTNVPDEDLPALYNHAEIYVGVSRPVELMVEGFGISLSEASACGIPVIGATSGGIPDAVRDGETGLLVDPESPEAVVRAVRQLLEDHEFARKLGAGGRRAVETFYNWDRVASEIIRIGQEHARTIR